MLILLGIIFFFVLLETGLRLGGFIVLSLQEHRNLISLKEKGAYRIMCLGESTTAAIEDSPWSSQLEKILNEQIGGLKFSVINKGVSATNTSIILSQLEENLKKYKPDMVITMMGINDAGEHLPQENMYDSEIRRYFNSFRCIKLARLIGLHFVAKIKEMDLAVQKKNKIFANGVQVDSLHSEGVINNNINQTNLMHLQNLDSNTTVVTSIGIDTYIKLGNLYFAQEKYSLAEDEFKKAISIDPKNSFAIAGLAGSYDFQGKFELRKELFKESEEIFLKAIRENLGGEKIKIINNFFNLGVHNTCLKDYISAERIFRKILEIEPSYYSANLNLGYLLLISARYNEAEQFFRKAIEINPNLEEAYTWLGFLSYELKKYSLAEEYFKKACSLQPKSYSVMTRQNYRKLRILLDKKGIKLICVQYPMRSIKPLRTIFDEEDGIIFVDNEKIFKEAVKKKGFKEYFKDMFAGDFGHCTNKGNWLLAENIVNVILREVFGERIQNVSVGSGKDEY